MCGIVGIIRFDGRMVRREELDAMVGSIVHRGPDDEGVLIEGGVGIGMRRLSIVDLSPAGHQPMLNEDQTVGLVFNGEIYNHRDIRSRLHAAGHLFRGHSDTETVLHGYEELGARGLVERLAGMFAFALFDRARRRLVLARDGFGIKPLYMRRTQGQISFASEIRALALDGAGGLSIDPAFCGSFLRVGYVPSPRTAFVGITKLEPGSLLTIDLTTGDTSTESFYRLAPAALDDVHPDVLLEELRELLNASVRNHLMADVPTGLFLSGGLDSSALTVFSNHHVAPPKTFSIGFSLSDRGDETQFAAAVARRAGNENIRIDLGPANLDDIAPIVAAIEEPLADSAVLPLWYLCRGTARHVKVALSGEGGDEVLGGYARYFWGSVVDDLRPLLQGHAERILGVTGRLPTRSLGVLNFARRVAKIMESVPLERHARYLAWFDIFGVEDRRALIGEAGAEPEALTERYRMLFAEAEELNLDALQALQYVDCRTMLLDNLLMKADKLSMAHSLEVRVPFLTRKLVEFGLGLPTRFKIGPVRDKRLMRRLLAPELGARIANRPKRGFEIPYDRWLREPAAAAVRERLENGTLVSALGFSRQAIHGLVERHLAGEDMGRKLFALISLEHWTQHFA
jgi:asparagine synthase (glutamine-hydrolysing)